MTDKNYSNIFIHAMLILYMRQSHSIQSTRVILISYTVDYLVALYFSILVVILFQLIIISQTDEPSIGETGLWQVIYWFIVFRVYFASLDRRVNCSV